MKSADELDDQIFRWWKEAREHCGTFANMLDNETVRQGFFEVLKRMPDYDRQRFLELAPKVAWFPGEYGVTFRAQGYVIFLEPTLTRKKDPTKTIAHESAHVVLDHDNPACHLSNS